MNKKLLFFGIPAILLGMFVFVIRNSVHSTKLASPLLEKGKLAVNLWVPQVQAEFADSNSPDITARAAYFVDTNTGHVLYEKNPYQRFPVASLTKIMTAIVTLENHSLEDEMPISNQAAAMEPDRMELIAGEKLSVEELLNGVFLVSANDAAESLAENIIGGREEFIKQMNFKALQLGMNDTLFINPTGLEEDGRSQYSSAYDTALMSRYAIKNYPHLVDISSTAHKFIPQTATHQDYDLYSGINLLTTYHGVLGLKTGYTPEAGLTLVTLARKNGHEVLGVILNSENRREEARVLLDYSFKKYK